VITAGPPETRKALVRSHEGPIPRCTAILPCGRRAVLFAVMLRMPSRSLSVTGTRRLFIDWVGGGPPLRLEPLPSLDYSSQGSPTDQVGRRARVAA
jgi:hypothetical protein